jgi:hypothetical protein
MILAKQSEQSAHEEINSPADLIGNPQSAVVKKPFVEPEISPAVDVLEATAFFQSTTTGGGI